MNMDLSPLDHAGRQRAPTLAYLALLIGAASLGSVLWRGAVPEVAQNAPRAHAGLSGGTRDGSGTAQDANVLPPELPWIALFRQLDQAALTGIRLDRVEPDGARRMLVVEGQAADRGTLLHYLSRLRQSGPCQDVRIAATTLADSGVHFRIEGRWS